ncbi:D-3-phosphoglycerate dehydrogenase [Aquipluma nitroreducens]|uniref:D-3-phosphoglycerate dehydrogenase n=1 Tax=Aquipluma nitroreducens TaxID=2010828 RepID=A0A5K7SGQ3_9BACT|nr:D-2-hydroxyacid dehydrogenase [Aquipluma nitroreducens]BBE20748.1 D-3-phosphoglycerate dehydrogenase [Aquipluma nitroreducens]
MKIVVLDGFAMNPGDLSWENLNELGECVIFDRTRPEEVLGRADGADALITNKVIIDKALMAKLSSLKYIGVTATGYNVVDVQAAAERNIVVNNIPAYSTNSVAQLVFSHILNVANRVELHANSVIKGDWISSADFSYSQSPQIELAGKTLGIVGFGRIGRRVAEIGLAFGMKVIFQNRSEKANLPSGIIQKGLSEVFTESDFVSLNCPLTAENIEFVNRDLIKTMKPTAVLINTGRGGLINEQDLADALNAGQLSAACLDVLSAEPPRPDNPLIPLQNCFITPHIAWATFEARQRLLNITIDNLKGFITGNPQNQV